MNCLFNSGTLPSHSGFRVQPNLAHLGIPSLALNPGEHLYFNMASLWYSCTGSTTKPFDMTGAVHVISVWKVRETRIIKVVLLKKHRNL